MDTYSDFFRKRLTELRIKKNVSEYQMSVAVGKSKGYVQQITSGRSLPSMAMFFEICDYLEISPLEFFDEKNREPDLVKTLAEKARPLEREKIETLITVAELFG